MKRLSRHPLWGNRGLGRGLCALLTLCLHPALAHAQTLYEPQARQGYYIALGVGPSLTVNDTDPHGTLPTWVGSGSALRFGEMLTQDVSLGLSIETSLAKGKRREGTVFALGFEACMRVWRELALRGGLGFGVVQVMEQDAASRADTEGGVSPHYSLGAHYSFFPFYDDGDGSGGWALSPTLRLSYAPASSVRATVAWVGVEITWWSGLEANKLLPEW